MKYKFTLKKNISGFKPDAHWKLILTGAFLFCMIAVSYNSYLYLYAKKQVSGEVSVVSTEVPVQLNRFATPEEIEESFKVYKTRQIKYEEKLAELINENKIIESVATTTATTTISVVATSSKQ